MPFGMLTYGGPGNHVLDVGPGTPTERGTFGGHAQLVHGQYSIPYSVGAATMRPLVTITVATCWTVCCGCRVVLGRAHVRTVAETRKAELEQFLKYLLRLSPELAQVRMWPIATHRVVCLSVCHDSPTQKADLDTWTCTGEPITVSLIGSLRAFGSLRVWLVDRRMDDGRVCCPHVCLSVCDCVISPVLLVRSSPKFLCMLPIAVARSSSESNNNNNDRLTAFDPGQPG